MNTAQNEQPTIRLLYTQKDLLGIIKSNIQNSNKIIDFFCTDFKSILHSNSSFSKSLVEKLKSIANNNQSYVNIYDYAPISQDNLTQQSNYYITQDGTIQTTNKNNAICVTNMHSSQSNILVEFVKQLSEKLSKQSSEQSSKQLPNGKKYKNITEILDALAKNYKDKQQQKDAKDTLIECIEKHLKKPILQQAKNFQELKQISGAEENLTDSLNKAFDELIEGINAIYKEGSSYVFEEIVRFFFNIVDIASIKKIFSKSNVAFLAVDALFEGFSTFMNIYEWKNSKYSYIIGSSIAKLLIQNIAPIITMFQNQILHNTLIIDNKTIIEFFGINTMEQCSSCITQNLGVYIKLDTSIEHNFSKIDTLQQYRYIANDKEICISNQSDINKLLKEQISISNNRLVYIESPYFNSLQLVNLINEEAGDTKKDPANQDYNYLIISNAPYKHNAGLSTYLIERLGNEIYYGKTKQQKTSSILQQKPDKNYNETIDYSKYQIKINTNNKGPYVLSLSPFVHISNNQYKTYETKYKEYEKLKQKEHLNDDNFWKCDEFEKNTDNMDKVANYAYIESFFKQPKDKQDILENEEKYFQESIKCLQIYLRGLTEIEINKVSVFGIECNATTTTAKTNFSATDIILLSLTYYVIKSFYKDVKLDVKLDMQLKQNYEYIQIHNEKINILPTNSYAIFDDSKIPLCVSKARKNKNAFCIEEFVEIIEEADSAISAEEIKKINTLLSSYTKSIDIESNNIESIDTKSNNIESNSQNIDITTIYEDIMQDFIEAFFPFYELLSTDMFAVLKKLTKTILTYKLKSFPEALFDEFGLMYAIYANRIQANTTSQQTTLKQTRRKAFIDFTKIHNDKKLLNSTFNNKSALFARYKELFPTIKDTTKDIIKNLPQTIALNIFNQVFVTNYEKSKQEFAKIMFLHFTYKYNYPYALKRKNESISYPMHINNTFLSFNFTNMIVGSKLCTGGLGDLQALFYHINSTNGNMISTYLLNKLISYLTLDELRSSDVTDDIIDDVTYFNNINYTSSISPRLLKLICNDEELKTLNPSINIQKRKEWYNQYRDKESNGIKAINAYHKVMDYLDDIAKGKFNTDNTNTPNPRKHREFLENLNIIGQNNIKALYVGIKEEQDNSTNATHHFGINPKNANTKEKRPKFIGRLATTIIIEDGLWIG